MLLGIMFIVACGAVTKDSIVNAATDAPGVYDDEDQLIGAVAGMSITDLFVLHSSGNIFHFTSTDFKRNDIHFTTGNCTGTNYNQQEGVSNYILMTFNGDTFISDSSAPASVTFGSRLSSQDGNCYAASHTTVAQTVIPYTGEVPTVSFPLTIK